MKVFSRPRESVSQSASGGGSKVVGVGAETDHSGSFRSFEDLKLASWLVGACNALGMEVPTPVQAGCVPMALEGRDIIGCARTGTGKTAAFALPVLHRLSEDPYGIFALVLTPSRELAYQVSDQFRALGGPLRVRVAVVVGGMNSTRQLSDLMQRPHIVVATPGRLADLIRSSGEPFPLRRLRFLVLDEADRLLEGTFGPDLVTILEHCPPASKRQHLLFSATMALSETAARRLGIDRESCFRYDELADELGGQISGLADGDERMARRRKRVLVARTVQGLRQRYLFLPSSVRLAYLYELLLVAGPAPEAEPKADEMALASLQRARKAHKANQEVPTGSDEVSGSEVDSGSEVFSGDDDNDDDDDDEEDDEEDEEDQEQKIPKKQEQKIPKKHRKKIHEKEDDEEEEEEEIPKKDEAEESDSSDESDWEEEEEDDFDIAEDESGKIQRAESAIVFVGTVRECEVVVESLRELGWLAVALHSVLRQEQRLAALAKFKTGVVHILVATDVASRGLDIPTVDLVVNYDVPRVPDDYVHRVGRTARAGRGGRAVSLVTERDVQLVHEIEKTVRKKLTLEKRVVEDSVLMHLTRVATAQRVARLRLADKGFEAALSEHKNRKQISKDRAEELAEKEAQEQEGLDGVPPKETSPSPPIKSAPPKAKRARKK